MLILKLEKRIGILRKAYEENGWNGNESIKLIEKQDIGIITILKNLTLIMETTSELLGETITSLKIDADKLNSILELLLYCDNLEINFLVLKFTFFA